VISERCSCLESLENISFQRRMRSLYDRLWSIYVAVLIHHCCTNLHSLNMIMLYEVMKSARLQRPRAGFW